MDEVSGNVEKPKCVCKFTATIQQEAQLKKVTDGDPQYWFSLRFRHFLMPFIVSILHFFSSNVTGRSANEFNFLNLQHVFTLIACLLVLHPESILAPSDGIGVFVRSGIHRKSNVIRVKELSNYIENNLERINEELKSVPFCKFFNCSVARRPENILKRNRYYVSDAYDHNRVVLKVAFDENEDGDGECNDYIAANHVDSHTVRHRFIASQAPLPQTIIDHWRMIWDYRCSQIVTLTKLIENNYYKADKYWPEDGIVKYGDIWVEHKNTKYQKEFKVLLYEIVNDSENSEKREIEHYFYDSWPDHGAPVTSDSFLDLIETIKQSKLHRADDPVIVHCSAGVGRTGTFILIYNMIEMGEQSGQVDFYNHLVKLRSQRAFATDGAEQYLYAHKCVAKYFSQK